MRTIAIFSLLVVLLPQTAATQTLDSTAVKKTVDSLLQASVACLSKGDFAKALDINSAASKIASEKLGPVSIANGSCVHIHALILFNKGDYAGAETTFKEAIAIREKVRGKEHADYLGSIINLAVVYKTTGNYDQAESLLLEAKEIFEVRKKNFKHPFYINCLANLADLYNETGDYPKAETMHLKVLELRARELGRKHPDYAKSLRNLGALYYNMGMYEKAISYIQQAIQVNESIYGNEHYEYAACLYSLASLYITTDELAKAEPLLLKTQEIWMQVYGAEHTRYALLLNGLGSLYIKMGNLKKAESVLLEAKSIFENALGTEAREYATVQNNLSNVYLQTDRIDLAEQVLAECVAISKKTLGESHRTTALYIYNMAVFYNRIWADEKAKASYEEAIRIWEKTSGKESLDYATGISGLAAHYLNTGDYKAAEPLYLDALAIIESNLGREVDRYLEEEYELTILYNRLGNQQKVDSLVQDFTPKDKMAISKGLKFLSEYELDLYVNIFQDHQNWVYSTAQNSKSRPLINTCFDNSLFYQGISLNAASKIKQLALKDSSSYATLQQLQSCQRLLASEYYFPYNERDTAQIAVWEARSNALEKELVRKVAGYADIFKQVDWQELRQQLRPGEAALELVRYPYFKPDPTDSVMYAALVLLPTDSAPHFIPLFEEKQLEALFSRPGYDEQLTVKSLYGSRSELLQLLWKPLEPLLGSAKTIYYAPAGLLHRINPAALLDADKQPLSASRAWVRVGSTRELVAGRLADRSFARDAATVNTAEIWGGIQYDMDSTAFAAANPLFAGDTTLGNLQPKDDMFRVTVESHENNALRGSDDDGVWKPLEGSDQEANQVEKHLQAAGFQISRPRGFAASEEHFKRIGQTESSPRILHVATHGFAYPDPKKETPEMTPSSETAPKLYQNPMLRSGLLLAGANYYWKNHRPLQHREDGVLVAYEVRDLNLQHTELAVLSACQTGLGDVVGSEGVYGLQRAFRIAGAKFLIVSLWQAPDTQTRQLMDYFYENWTVKGESLRDAFNHAQQALREQEPNPYMWAGFVLIE